jgi:IMP dehydrogenase
MLPLVDEDHRVVGLYVFSDVLRIKSGEFSHYNLDENGQLRVGAAIGVGEDALARFEMLLRRRVDVVVIDTAHGDSKNAINTLRELKKAYPSIDVVVGNVSEAASAKRLLDAGADGIKVGQGPGSICTTRIIAGIGCPQVTAVYNCAKISEQYGVPVCADGGIRYSGDITIAIGAGAHSVMLGSMLASTKEAPGEIVFLEGRRWKRYRGMGSIGAMEAHAGSRERYGQKETKRDKLIAEGVEGLVQYQGELSEVLFQLVGGLRSGMGYVGAKDIEELRAKADFLRISTAGQAESHPHDIRLTALPPNYKGGK